MMSSIYRSMFWGLAVVGRPVGGIRPRRITHWVGDRGFGGRYREQDFRWVRDRYGLELRLNPCYFLDRNIIAFGAYDPATHRFLAERVKAGMTCFDVGANIGAMTLHMAKRVGAGGRVHAFEPVPHVRERLEAHVARNGFGDRVRVHGVALSNAAGVMTMSVAPPEAANQGQGSLVNTTYDSLSRRVDVPTQTVDAFVEEQGVDRIDLMKVDIQGAEPLLLEGGKRVFGEMSPDLLVEVSPEDLAGLGRTGRDLVRQIEGYGYSLYEVGGDGRPGRRVRSAEIPPDYAHFDVFCTKKG